MKKYVLIFLALALAVSCAACGKATEPVPARTTAPVATTAPTATPTPTAVPTATPTPTVQPTATPVVTATPTPTAPPTPAPTTVPATVVYYQVRVTGYSRQKDAETACDAIRKLQDTIKAGYSSAYVGGSNSTWYVISGTFSKVTSAQAVVNDLTGRGYTASYVKVDGNGRVIDDTAPAAASSTTSLYQVRVTGYSSQKDAEAARDAIRQLNDTIKAGYANAYVGGSGSEWYVISGTYSKETGAQAVVSDLISRGYSAIYVKT